MVNGIYAKRDQLKDFKNLAEISWIIVWLIYIQQNRIRVKVNFYFSPVYIIAVINAIDRVTLFERRTQ